MQDILYLITFSVLSAWFYNKNDELIRPRIGQSFLISFAIYLVHTIFFFEKASLFSTSGHILLLFAAGFFVNSFSANRIAFLLTFSLLVFSYIYSFTSFFPIDSDALSDDSTTINTVIPVDEKAEFIIGVRSDDEFRSLPKNIISKSAIYRPIYDITTSENIQWYTIDVAEDQSNEYYFSILKNNVNLTYLEWNESISCPSSPPPLFQSNKKIQTRQITNDPLMGEMWHLNQFDYSTYYELLHQLQPQKKVQVAIIDTGVDRKHEDLQDAYRSVNPESDEDPIGHGTHCAGIVAATSNNGIGIASLSSKGLLQISSYRVFNNAGFTSQGKILEAIYKAVDSGADIISMSLGGPSNDKSQKAYQMAIDYANSKKVIVIAAAGNENINATRRVPAGIDGVICVGALDTNGQKASFSNTLDDIKYGLWAPGVQILSTLPGNTYGKQSGTSMATPFVAGLAAIVKVRYPSYNIDEVFDALTQNPDKEDVTKLTKQEVHPVHIVKNLIQPSNIWQ